MRDEKKRSAYKKEWAKRNANKVLCSKKKWRDNHKEQISEYYKNRRKERPNLEKERLVAYQFRKTHPWFSSYSNARSRCLRGSKYYKGKGIKFLMSTADFKMLWFRDRAWEMKSPSIDRIDSDGNYELLNCRFIERSQNSKLSWIGRDSEAREKH